MKKKEILYVLLDKYATHEMVFLSQAINDGEMGPRECPKYINKVVAQSMEPVTSISGTRTLPDYTFETAPKDYAALVLIGGHGWRMRYWLTRYSHWSRMPSAKVASLALSAMLLHGNLVEISSFTE